MGICAGLAVAKRTILAKGSTVAYQHRSDARHISVKRISVSVHGQSQKRGRVNGGGYV